MQERLFDGMGVGGGGWRRGWGMERRQSEGVWDAEVMPNWVRSGGAAEGVGGGGTQMMP